MESRRIRVQRSLSRARADDAARSAQRAELRAPQRGSAWDSIGWTRSVLVRRMVRRLAARARSRTRRAGVAVAASAHVVVARRLAASRMSRSGPSSVHASRSGGLNSRRFIRAKRQCTAIASRPLSACLRSSGPCLPLAAVALAHRSTEHAAVERACADDDSDCFRKQPLPSSRSVPTIRAGPASAPESRANSTCTVPRRARHRQHRSPHFHARRRDDARGARFVASPAGMSGRSHLERAA